jgi:hypothetical protein
MIDVRPEAETHFRPRRISLRLRLPWLRKVCSLLIASAATAESGFIGTVSSVGGAMVGIAAEKLAVLINFLGEHGLVR